MRDRRLRLALEQQYLAKLFQSQFVVAIERDRYFHLNLRFVQTVLDTPQQPHLRPTHWVLCIAFQHFAQQRFGERIVLIE
jgi:hypothetical protein